MPAKCCVIVVLKCFDSNRKMIIVAIKTNYWLKLPTSYNIHVGFTVSCFYLISESVTFTKQPPNPQVIVEGVNSRRVWLVWSFTLNSSETLRSITIERKRPGENVPTRIATRPYANSSFILVNNKFKEKYSARSPSTLVLKDVKRTDEYIYSLEVFYWNGIRNGRKKSDVHVLVFGEYESTFSVALNC